MKSTDAVAILVGEDRYVAAGGKIDPDLFSEDGDKWVDPEIAQQLEAEIMEAEAQRVGEELGLGWVRPERKRVGEGKGVSERVGIGGRRTRKKHRRIRRRKENEKDK